MASTAARVVMEYLLELLHQQAELHQLGLEAKGVLLVGVPVLLGRFQGLLEGRLLSLTGLSDVLQRPVLLVHLPAELLHLRGHALCLVLHVSRSLRARLAAPLLNLTWLHEKPARVASDAVADALCRHSRCAVTHRRVLANA